MPVFVSATVGVFLCSSPSYLESSGSVTSIPVFFSSGVSGPSGTIVLGVISNVPGVYVTL